MDQLFTLADDVEFITVADVDERLRQSFEHDETDVVITHRNTRTRSKVLSKDAAALLQNFARPLSWAEAILRHALLTSREPQELAELVFPLLMELKEEGFLRVTVGKSERSQQLFTPGQVFLQYTVKNVCQVTEDSCVYRVESADGRSSALKIFHRNETLAEPLAYRNERAVLQLLDGTVNPKLEGFGQHAGVYYLVLEWCSGSNCESTAANFRNYNVKQNLLEMLDCCLQVLRAFRHIHRQGVLHGDIHPNNVLIDADKTVRIIDYGEAIFESNQHRAIRGGIDFYYEPEMAAALLTGDPHPPVTVQSEQYSLAVLLYRMIAGQHYLLFSLEPEKAYRQIMEEPPLPFSMFDFHLPACFDETFATALAKEPAKRYPSLDAFIEALLRCRKEVETSSAFFVQGKKDPEEKFVRMLIRKYGWDSPFIKQGLAVPPVSSVQYGAAGIGYMYYRMACVLERADLLALADVWCNRAAVNAQDYSSRFYTADRQISETTVGRNALYHSPTGVHLVQALTSSCKGDRFALAKAVADYLHAADLPCDHLDVATGKAGLLIGSSILLKKLAPDPFVDTTALRRFTNDLLQELWQQLDRFPAMHQPNAVDYFGLAHGWAGQIYAALLWCRASGDRLPAKLMSRIGELLAIATRQDDTLRWPVAHSISESWPGWCSGSAGYVFLWSLLYEYFNDEQFLSLAEQSGRAILNDRHSGADLCCGLAGQAYAFLKLHQLTGKPVYRQKLTQIRYAIHDQLSSSLLRNNSLYKGETGIGVLFAELRRPELACMPLFE